MQTRRLKGPRDSMRVLMCIESLASGGKERQAVELIKGLCRRPDIQCRLICLEPYDFYLDQLADVRVSVEFVVRRVRWDVGLFHRLYRTIKNYEPDVIHTYGLMSSFYTLPLARWMRVPVVNASIQNAFTTGGFRWSLEKLLLRASDYSLANSYAGLRSRSFSKEERNNFVIYNGFDFSRVDRVATRRSGQRRIRDCRTKTVGMVASFSNFKDYSTFIQAALKITAKRNDVVFLAVGDGETLQSCKEMAAGVEAIKFLGRRRNVEEIVATFDIGVLATFTEGLSNSVMEYMAFGKPVVATNGGGTEELVMPGETGFLVPPGNPDLLAAKIEYLLDNPEIAKRMGKKGEERIRREFSITRMVEETVRLYNVALSTSKRVPVCDDFREGSAES